MDECLSGKAPKDMVKWGLKIKETTDEDGLVYQIEDE